MHSVLCVSPASDEHEPTEVESDLPAAVREAMKPMEMKTEVVQVLQVQEVEGQPRHLQSVEQYCKWFQELQGAGMYYYLSPTGPDDSPIGVLLDTGANRACCGSCIRRVSGSEDCARTADGRQRVWPLGRVNAVC